jgi:hypothetical protein
MVALRPFLRYALLGTLITCQSCTARQESNFRAGFARTSITPPLVDTWTDADGNSVYQPEQGDTFEDRNGNGVFDAYWLAGFQQARPAQSVHDGIFAIAAVLDDGATRVAVVAIDAIGFFYDDVVDVRNRLPDDWAIDHTIIASTHNHEVPDLLGLWGPNAATSGVNSDYLALVKNQIIGAIGQAVQQLRPAALHLSKIDIADEELVTDSRRPIVLDPDIRVMRFVSTDGAGTIGTLLSWADHPETVWSQNLEITADFPGYFRDGVEHGLRYGDRVVREGIGGIPLYINGAIGGLMTTDPSLGVYDPHLDETFTTPTHDKARALGYRLADAVLSHLDSESEIVDPSPRLRLLKETITVPVTNQGFLAGAQAGLLTHNMAEDGSMTSEVNLLTLGDAWIVTIPGEIYPELINGGIETPAGADYPVEPVEVPPIRAMMEGRVNFVFGLANDEIGYIIPKSEWDELVPYLYGADESPYGEIVAPGPDAASAIHKAVQRLAEQATLPR